MRYPAGVAAHQPLVNDLCIVFCVLDTLHLGAIRVHLFSILIPAMTFQQFTLRLVFGIFLLLALVGLFNRVVDPFWYYRDIEIKGLNTVKTKFRRFERHVKPALLVREQPQAIILGSSFSEVGFDPTNPFFTNHGRMRSMNFALAGASWEMVQCHFEFAVTHAAIKRALIGFHPGNLPAADCSKDFSLLGKISTGELLFSDRALLASLQTIQEQDAEKPSHTREGMYFYAREAAGVDNRFQEYYRARARKNPQCLNAAIGSTPTPIPDAKIPLDLSGLRQLIKTARKYGVELILFAYPHHATSLELDRQCGEQSTRWQAMKQITHAAEEAAAGSAVRIWNFDAYNDITAEPVGTRTRYWQDPEHFNFEMGNVMLADMFDETSGRRKLGRLLASNRIETDFQDYMGERAAYLQSHPEFLPGLQKLLPE